LVRADEELKSEPNSPQLLEERASIYVELQQWDKAITDLRAAIAARPDRSSAYVELASLHVSHGRLIGARFSRSRVGVQHTSRLAVTASVICGVSGAGGGLGLGGGWIRTRVVAS